MIITGKKFSKPELSRVINGDTILSTDDTADNRQRLDLLLVAKYPEYNRSTLQTFIKKGFVTVNQTPAEKPNEKVSPDTDIQLHVPEGQKILPKLPIIYEDEHVLVVNKPSGLLSMAKGEYCPEPTLEDYGLLVHRLDRDTSGVVILAKDPETQTMLRKQFQNRKTHKTYVALVDGTPKLFSAVIDLPIARNLKHPTTFQVSQNGKPAQTTYHVIESHNGKSLIELKPTTGRTHQLRVHLHYLNTPILGDPVYGEAKSAPRLMLHAQDLEITIPGTEGEPNQRKTFHADLPPLFEEILRK